MSVQLAILGFLREKDFYGYELKKIMERLMGQWTDIKFGSIYYALEKLTRDKLVLPIYEEKAGSNPARTVYRITDAGREEFCHLLEETLTSVSLMHNPIDIGIFFSQSLDPEKVIEILKQRAEKVDGWVTQLEKYEREHAANPRIPEIATVMLRHSRLHVQVERDFLNELAENFAQRDLFGGRKLGEYISAHHLPDEADAPVKRKAIKQ